MKLYCDDALYNLTIHHRTPSKPNVLFMHGFMGSSTVFEPLLPHIGSVCNAVTIDLAGHGESACPAEPDRFRAESQAADLLSILDRLQLNNLWLYGYSMGGRLAQFIYLAAPEQFDGFILESTHCGIKAESDRKERRLTDENRATQIENDLNAFLDAWTALPLFRSPDIARSFDYRAIQEQQNPLLMAASLRGFGAGNTPYLCEKLQQIDTPVCLIAGKADEKYVDKMREMHHLLPDSVLEVVPGAGHRVHTDQPEQIADTLTKFFDRYA